MVRIGEKIAALIRRTVEINYSPKEESKNKMNYFNVGKIVKTTKACKARDAGLVCDRLCGRAFLKKELSWLSLMRRIVLSKRWPLPVTASTRTSTSSSLRICTISMPSRNSRALASRLQKKTWRIWRMANFYYHEIIGLDVYEKWPTNRSDQGNPATRCQWCLGGETHKGKRDLLLPYIPPVVLKIDIPGNRVDVDILEGLDDEDWYF